MQVLRAGEERLEKLTPRLDELTELSRAGNLSKSFARIHALWFLIADTLSPFFKTMPVPQVLALSAKRRPESIRNHRLAAPVRVGPGRCATRCTATSPGGGCCARGGVVA